MQIDDAMPKIEVHVLPDIDQQRRRDQLDAFDQRLAHIPAQGLDIVRAAHRQRARKIPVPDKSHAGRDEGDIAERIIRMLMRVDHITDWLSGNLFDRLP